MFKFLLVVILIAVTVYLLVRAIERRGIAPRDAISRRFSRPDSRPTVGPDDDPDFIWNLNKRIKRKRPDDPT